MIIDTQRAFEDGNQGVTIYHHNGQFVVSVKTDSGGFVIGYGESPQSGLDDALGVVPRIENFDDLLG